MFAALVSFLMTSPFLFKALAALFIFLESIQ